MISKEFKISIEGERTLDGNLRFRVDGNDQDVLEVIRHVIIWIASQRNLNPLNIADEIYIKIMNQLKEASGGLKS